MEIGVKEQAREIIEKEFSFFPYEDKFLPAFLDFFKARFSDSLLAVVLYGSKLFEPGNQDSLYDFYVVIDAYEKVHSSFLHVMLNRILPPSVYLADVEVDGERRGAKYNIISLQDLKNYILNPPEIYVVGRFAKRSYLMYYKNEIVKNTLFDLFVESFYFCLCYTIPLLIDREKFSFEELVREILSLSYKGEVRIEDPQKLDKLYAPFQDFYLTVYKLLFSSYLTENEGVIMELNFSDDFMLKEWVVVGDPIPSFQEVVKFLKISARRGVMRWPKGLITFKGYREYLERKAKKSGEDIQVSDLDRKLPLVFGWRHLIKLVSQGKLKSGIQKEIEKKKKKKKW
jgi:hypothetical protein